MSGTLEAFGIPLSYIRCLRLVASTAMLVTATSCATPAGPGQSAPSSAVVALNSVQSTLDAVTLGVEATTGDGEFSGEVRLTAPAPGAGVLVTLASDNDAVSVPSSVQILGGASVQSFKARSYAPSAARNVTITATYQGISRSAQIVVRPTLAPPPPSAGSVDLTGAWSGTVLCGTGSCKGLSLRIEMNVVQTGRSASGTCRTSTGISGVVHLTFADDGYIIGGCAGNGMDMSYIPSADVLNLMWKVDYVGVLRR